MQQGLRRRPQFWCSVILGNSKTTVRSARSRRRFGAASFWVTAKPRRGCSGRCRSFGAASFWVTAKHEDVPGFMDAGFGAASFWVTAKLIDLSTIEKVSFGAASFWVTAKHKDVRLHRVQVLVQRHSG